MGGAHNQDKFMLVRDVESVKPGQKRVASCEGFQPSDEPDCRIARTGQRPTKLLIIDGQRCLSDGKARIARWPP